jgi:hypothetical protein
MLRPHRSVKNRHELSVQAPRVAMGPVDGGEPPIASEVSRVPQKRAILASTRWLPKARP